MEVDGKAMCATGVTREHQCGQQLFGFSRKCTEVTKATHCYHHCGPEGMEAPIFGDDHWFCSLACYKAHLVETPSYSHQCQLQTLPTRARQEYGFSDYIKAAPPRSALAMFGGPLSPAEFLAVTDKPAVEVVTLRGHDITQGTIMEVRHKQTDQEGFRQVFEVASTSGTTGSAAAGTSLFDEMAQSIQQEKRERITSTQGRSIFQTMAARRGRGKGKAASKNSTTPTTPSSLTTPT